MQIGLILAAGRSSRFGPENKLIADLDGRPLVAHAARALSGVPLDRRLIVAADRAVAEAAASLCPDLRAVMIDNRRTGQSDTLRAGVDLARHLGATRLLIVLGDMPFVTADHLAAVLAACGPDRPAASTDGERPMPPACFPAAMLSELARAEGDKGAAPLLRALPPEALIPAPSRTLIDIDTEAALTEARAAAGNC